MKAKSIKSVLRKKFDALVKSITDESLRELVQKNAIITGGSIASMLLHERVNDYDIYFRDKATVLRVAYYYVEQFKQHLPPMFSKRYGGKAIEIRVLEEDLRVRIMIKSAGVASTSAEEGYEYFETIPDPNTTAAADYLDDAMDAAQDQETSDEKYRPVFLTDNAITLTNGIQLVLRFYGEPDEIHKNYDFVHCTNYWTSWDSNLVLRQDALESLLAKDLRYVGSKYPICSLVRLRKFLLRGWSVTAGQLLKICWQISELDLKDLSVLREQLVGVDTAYFLQVIAALKERDPQRVDGAYLMELIDRIF